MNDLPIRCFCTKHPLLAVCGRTTAGELFVHVKHRMGSKTAESVHLGGTVRLKCYHCGRWHTVRMKTPAVTVNPEPLPESFGL